MMKNRNGKDTIEFQLESDAETSLMLSGRRSWLAQCQMTEGLDCASGGKKNIMIQDFINIEACPGRNQMVKYS